MLWLYRFLTSLSAPLLRRTLSRRCRRGKEDPARLPERQGQAGKPRPKGTLLWLHAASVGESQSALILITALLKENPALNILVTTGTVTSAQLMENRLPKGTFHQYYPLDHPRWVASFLDHWQPDVALWLESELWPNMLMQLKQRGIPAALINARLSPRSTQRWQKFKGSIKTLLSTFSIILAQTAEDAAAFETLGGENIKDIGNLKYSAAPLPYDTKDLETLEKATMGRPLWLYASTHDGEEDMACRLHRHLKKTLPDLLTIIVPRHPERRKSIQAICKKYDLSYCTRSEKHSMPKENIDIYIADTMGELGLFYRLSPLACIGRSFSHDGGGGHNPLEAAQLECAVLHGPRVQNLQKIYDDMDNANASLRLKDEAAFQKRLATILTDEEGLISLQNKALRFAHDKGGVLEKTMEEITPLLSGTRQEQEQREEKCA